MAKLNQLRTLEQMLRTYDSMTIDDANVIQLQGVCVERLVDDITKRLDRLRESKTQLSCRNVLVANYETMTDARHWLGSRLFSDLPKEESKVLKEKKELMVYLMTALMLKIMDVDADYADTFFCKLKESYKRKRITNYELWKAQLPEVTMELLTRFQTELTADMLAMGVLKYDLKPSHEEVEQVQLEKVLRKLPHDKKYPEDFTEECAKLRRYSHWDGEQFCVDYQLLRKYMFQHFGEMTSEQHVALFEYDVQMRMIHEDMKRLVGAEAPKCTGAQSPCALETDEELFKFIHPSISGEEEWQIHEEVKRLVTHHGVQEIGQYLYQMAREKKILLPQMPSVAYAELVRMGMPSSEGFNKKTFLKYYLRG